MSIPRLLVCHVRYQGKVEPIAIPVKKIRLITVGPTGTDITVKVSRKQVTKLSVINSISEVFTAYSTMNRERSRVLVAVNLNDENIPRA